MKAYKYVLYVLSLEIYLSSVGVGVQLTGLTPPYVCACPKQGPEFLTLYVVVLLYSARSVKMRGDIW